MDKNLELISRRLTPPLLSDTLADGDVIKYDSASDSWTAATAISGASALNLSSGNIFVGNASNQANEVSVSGDVTLSNTGAVTAAATQNSITSIPNLATVAATQNSITSIPNLDTVGTIGTGTWEGTAVADTYVANDLTIDGGTVDNSVIGGSTPAAGTFTTVNVAEDGKLDFTNTAPGTSGDATGIIFSFTAGATLAVGDVVYMGTGGKVLLADANATTSMPALGICTSASTDTNPVDVMIQGLMKLTGWSFTVGADIFISGTAGDVTATAPSASGDTVQKVGVAVASDTVYFNFNTTELVLA